MPITPNTLTTVALSVEITYAPEVTLAEQRVFATEVEAAMQREFDQEDSYWGRTADGKDFCNVFVSSPFADDATLAAASTTLAKLSTDKAAIITCLGTYGA